VSKKIDMNAVPVVEDTERKLILVQGQRFEVPIDTDNEAVRAALVAQFPDIATAAIKEDFLTEDGVKYKTVSFIKEAGTKGATA
jgi:hypothetical protein